MLISSFLEMEFRQIINSGVVRKSGRLSLESCGVIHDWSSRFGRYTEASNVRGVSSLSILQEIFF